MFIALGLLILILIIGWAYIYKQHFTDIEIEGEKQNKFKWAFYKLLSKEAYFPDLFLKIFKIF
ncbi:MAG TPA: hypothetical protein EYH43_01410 [Persephonella sp.]|nr:hypothetical protein [Persephonella sp.]